MDYVKVPSRRWECIAVTVVRSDPRAVVLVMDPSDMDVIRELEVRAMDESSSVTDDNREFAVGACAYDPEHGPVVVLKQGEHVSSIRAGGRRRDVLLRVVDVGVGPEVVRLRWRVKSCRPAASVADVTSVPDAEDDAQDEAERERLDAERSANARKALDSVLRTVTGLRDELDRESVAGAEGWLETHGFGESDDSPDTLGGDQERS